MTFRTKRLCRKPCREQTSDLRPISSLQPSSSNMLVCLELASVPELVPLNLNLLDCKDVMYSGLSAGSKESELIALLSAVGKIAIPQESSQAISPSAPPLTDAIKPAHQTGSPPSTRHAPADSAMPKVHALNNLSPLAPSKSRASCLE